MRDLRDTLRPKHFFIGNASIDVTRLPESLDFIRSLGGSARNASEQADLLGVPNVLIAAVGGDPDGQHILTTMEQAGRPTHGIVVMPDRNTLVYKQIDTGNEDVSIEKSANPASDAHTLDAMLGTMPPLLTDSLVYGAGLTRKPGVIDGHYELEDALDELRARGATIAMDPGRAPDDTPDRLLRSQTFMSYPQNLERVDFWALNPDEFTTYFSLTDDEQTLLKSATEQQVRELADHHIMEKATPALVCITLGKNGLILYARNGDSALVGAPAVDRRLTKVGLGDSTKAGMIAAILHESQGAMSPDVLASLSADQLQRVAAYGSAVSTHRIRTGTYGNAADVARTIDDYAKYYQRYGITPDYLG